MHLLREMLADVLLKWAGATKPGGVQRGAGPVSNDFGC
jgi:hypothetical protein